METLLLTTTILLVLLGMFYAGIVTGWRARSTTGRTPLASVVNSCLGLFSATGAGMIENTDPEEDTGIRIPEQDVERAVANESDIFVGVYVAEDADYELRLRAERVRGYE